MGYLDTVNADGSYNLRVIMGIVLRNAEREAVEYARMGLPTTLNEQIGRQLQQVWLTADCIRASLIAGWENAKYSPTERRARRLEVEAEKLEGAIPSDRNRALELRGRAFALRLEAATDRHLIAAE